MRLTRLVAPFVGIGAAGGQPGTQRAAHQSGGAHRQPGGLRGARRGVRQLIPRQRGSGEFHRPSLTSTTPESAAARPEPADTATSDDVVGLYLLGPLTGVTVRTFRDSLTEALDLTPPPPLALILDLRGTTSIDDDGCDALLDIDTQLRPEPTQLHLAASNAAQELLENSGLLDDLGTTAVHDNARTAVLAAYASLPGPGVATSRLRQALFEPFAWLELS